MSFKLDALEKEFDKWTKTLKALWDEKRKEFYPNPDEKDYKKRFADYNSFIEFIKPYWKDICTFYGYYQQAIYGDIDKSKK